MPYRHHYLTLVSESNSNKYYEMVQESELDDFFIVRYGRVGGHESIRNYPLTKWNSQYNSKLSKGYTDITKYKLDSASSVQFADTDNSKINLLLKRLQSYSLTTFQTNYNLSIDSVTQLQIEAAQELLNDCFSLFTNAKKNTIATTDTFDTLDYNGRTNAKLLELYRILPRKMKYVPDYLIDTYDLVKVNTLLENEQEVLDSLVAQYGMNKNDNTETVTLMEYLGIEIYETDDTETLLIRNMMGESVNHFKNAYRVINKKTREQFTYKDKTELLWHGSRNSNWINILKTGLLIRPSGVVLTGAMFGNGVYFANKARKSIGYTSLQNSYWANGDSNEGFLSLYNVYIGRPYDINTHLSGMYDLNYDKVKKLKYDSVFAHSSSGFLYNDEIIVYDIKQSDINYLVEIKS